MEFHYSLEGDLYRYEISWVDDTETTCVVSHKKADRTHMVHSLMECLDQICPKKLEIYIEGAEEPLQLHHTTLSRITKGDSKLVDHLISPTNKEYDKHPYMDRWLPLRAMPGQERTYECPACGRGADLERNLHCAKCGITFICAHQYRGVFADMRDALDAHPELDRFYIDRSWNDNPPWMSRETLIKTLDYEPRHSED